MMMNMAISQDHMSDAGRFTRVEPRSGLKLRDHPVIKTEAKEGAARTGFSWNLPDGGNLLWLAWIF